jgi:hypothetical protein
VPREELASYPMDRSMSIRLGHYLAGRDQPYLT